MRKLTQLFIHILPVLFMAFGLFGVNESAWGISQTKLNVNVSGNGTIKVNTSASQPSDAWSSSTVSKEQYDGWSIGKTDTYYIWVNPNSGYRCTGVSDCSWNSNGYYTISFKGATLQKNATKTVTATFVGNSYTISFEGNGNTSGSMDNQSGFVYGTAKTLNANAFGRAYTVTYDANGGTCGTSSATATYSFNGWKSSNSTSYGNKASISTFSPAPTTNGATVILTAQWTSASVTLPSATKDGAVLEGWYVGSIAEGNKITTATYTPTANVKLVANWINKYDFEITGDDYTINNEAWNKTSAFNFVHADEANMTTTIEKTDVISYDRAKNTITALKIGTSKITFTQNTSTTVNNGTIEYTITVDSVANNLSVSGTSFTKYVDQEVTSVRSNQNSDGEISTTSSNHNLAHYDIANNKIVIPNSDAQKLPFDDVAITISQAATAKYKAKKHTITLTVNKYANSLSCSWGGWSKNVNFDSHTAVTFTSTNTEAGAPAITVDKVSGGAVADYNSSTKKIDANHREGTVIWEVEQVENYKYVRAFEKCTVNVGTVAAPDCDILLYSSDPDKEASKISAITLNGLGVAMTFDIKYNGLGGTVKVKRTYNNGSSDETEYTATAFAGYTNRSITLGANVSKVEFVKKGTDDPYINTIRVTRKKYFDIENKAGSAITEMTMPLNIHGGVVKRDTFYIDYSTCEGTIKLENHHPRIKFAATNSNSYSFSTGTAHHGRPAIALTYTSPANDAENITDTIYIYTPSDHKKLIIHAQSKGKLQTTLHYIGKASYSADTTNIASMALFEVRDENNDLVANPVITLGTGTTSSVTLANDNKSIASLCGNSNDGTTGNVTASYAGDGTYEAATNNGLSQNFTINRLKDEVSFDSGYESMVVGEEIDLTEWATSCTSGSDITVTSVFKDYIVIEDGKVKAVAKGDGRLRAASAGNCTYNSGVKFLNIAVRNPEDPCESSLLYSSKLIKVGAYSHTSSSPVTYTIPDGPQDKLTFKVWKVPAATQEATLQILDKNENVLQNGTIDYGAGSLSGSEPDAPNKEINMANYPGAKKLRFYGGGTLNKYFSEVRISQKAYLTASTSSVTMSTVQACDTAKGQFTVDYSDVSHIQLSQTNNDFSYEVWEGETKLIGFENGCKSYGTYTVKFFYVPQAKGPYSNTVTISASGKSQTITLNGTANKPDRTIVWDIPSGNEISATQSLDLTAYAETSCLSPAGGVYYTAVPADAVTIDGNHITFKRAATVTVTAHTVPSDDYNDALTVDKVWTVGKVGTQMRTLPTITSTITYGDTKSVVTWNNESWVAEDTLAHVAVSGSIAYVGPDIFDAAGAANLTFNFTPSNVNTYDVCQFTVPVTVQKATPSATPSAEAITYGAAVNTSVLSNSGVAGIWSWKDEEANAAVLDAGTHNGLNVHFTPSDAANYNEIDGTVSLTVNQATPDATPSAAAITYGAAVNTSVLSNSGVAGTWSWKDEEANAAVLDAGTYNGLNVHFTPSDTKNYTSKDATVTLTVNKADADATVTVESITYGQKVSESELINAGTTVGTWAWDDADKNLQLSAGNHGLTVHFTPSSDNYNGKDASVTLIVNPATPDATPSAANIVYGTPITSSELSNSGVDGTWEWNTEDNDAILNAGTHTLDVHFTPNSNNYTEKDATVSLTVTQATPTGYSATASAIIEGQAASNSTITNTGIAGTWAWVNPSATYSTAGTYDVAAIFTPENTNYQAVETTLSLTVNVPINEFIGTDGDWSKPENWTNGVPTVEAPDVIVKEGATLTINEDVTIGDLTIEKNGGVLVVEEGSLMVIGESAERTGYGDLYVANGGEVEVVGTLNVGDLTVEASIGTANGTATSGQVVQAENVAYANAYIEINMDPRGSMDDTKWYGFTVPFEVNAHTGVSRKEGDTYRQCVYGTHHMVAEYDAAKRLSSGKGWKYLTGTTLNPGQFYYFTVNGNYNTYRFKASGTSYNAVTEKSLLVNGTGANANWNAVGNSMLQHATADFTGSGYVQVYQNGYDSYKTVSTSEATFVVGCPFFIQASEATTLTLNVQTEATEVYYAPRRAQAEKNSAIRVNFTSIDGGCSDQIYVSATDYKEQDGYVLGRDLSKAGVGTALPQMWVEEYGQKLSVNEAVWYGNNAYYTLGLYAPKNGEYTLKATQAAGNTQLYLTLDGMPIWNISESDYTVSLTKGTTNSYGLMMVKAPKITTDVEEVFGNDEQGSKVMIDGVLYILRNGQMYDATGKKIR